MGAWARGRDAAALLPLVTLLFALARPVMIDDTLFLKAAAQIRRDPHHPFDFAINWYGWEEPFWWVFKNPPGLSYWLAAVETVFGEREVALHAALLPFAVLAVLAGVRLARRFANGSPWVTAAWAASPAFLVSAATLMADVPSLALSLWGLVLWIEGTDADSPAARRLGAVLAGLAVVVKYTAVLGVAGLALYSVLVTDATRRRQQAVDLWPALLPAAAWSLLTLATHGRNHLMDALTVGGGGLDPNPGWVTHRGIAFLTFVAATGVFPLVLAAPGLFQRRGLRLGLGAALVGLLAGTATGWVWSPRGVRPGAVALVGMLAALGALALLEAFREGLAGGDRDGRFLAAWIVLHVVYLWLWSWTIAARFVLPVLPALAILLARSLGARPGASRGGRAEMMLAGAALLALAVSAGVLRADGYAGEFYRRAVPQIAAQARAEGRRGLFVGAWGFQHYAERAGLARLNVDTPALVAGDIVLQPYYAANRELPRALAGRLERVANIAGPPPPLGIHTMNINAGAGFYSSVYGPLPFFPAHLPSEGLIVWRVRGD
jgi:hypothetical protein